MPNLVVPETSWGPNSFGLQDFNYAQIQMQVRHRGAALPGLGTVVLEHAGRHAAGTIATAPMGTVSSHRGL